MGLLNYTTKIEPEQTISEIRKMLSRHGVTAMMTEYDGPQVSAVSFRLNIDGKPMSFKMPCNWRAVLEIFKSSKDARKRGCVNPEQATRTAWRIIHRWTEAQLALVEVNMVTVPQVFLPYAIMRDGRTLAETVTDNPSFLLGDGGATKP
jgi:hypothetical protein